MEPVSYTHLDVYKRQLQDLCMKYNRDIKHNETIKYLGERVGDVSVCVRMYVSFYM